jgi:hypothetical protein
MSPFPVLRHQIENKSIVTNNIKSKTNLFSQIPFFRVAFRARQVILHNERRKSSYDGVQDAHEDARFHLVRHSQEYFLSSKVPAQSYKTEMAKWIIRKQMEHAEQGGTTIDMIFDLTKSYTCTRSTPNQSIRQHCFQPTFVHTPRRSMLPLGKAESAMQSMGRGVRETR